MRSVLSNEQPIEEPEIQSYSEETKQFSGFFELLSQIDQRLKKEDEDYRNRYYSNQQIYEN